MANGVKPLSSLFFWWWNYDESTPVLYHNKNYSNFTAEKGAGMGEVLAETTVTMEIVCKGRGSTRKHREECSYNQTYKLHTVWAKWKRWQKQAFPQQLVQYPQFTFHAGEFVL